MKRLNVEVDDNLHRLLRIAVAEQATTVKMFVNEAIAEKLKKQASTENIEKEKEVAQNG